ncbi:hypothetical protein C8F01DRAFT_1119738 [Mycena amicta]|nr:hypothetical protein C8F01DRAFT_1119738 [Mycena amicta]
MEDPESLFGSPPPTPTRGRSPSPALALPGATANIDWNVSAQNVGTIALPGSHNVAELAVNPLASSLSSSLLRDAPRPPAQPNVALANPPSRKRTRAKPKVFQRPTPPPIYLPGPSDPLPPNLLRSQVNLLGTAGVVAGIRPFRLAIPNNDNDGITSANPIVIHDAAPPQRRPSRKPALSKQSDLDILRLSPPSTRDIIRALVEQGEVYAVLNDIMQFVASRTNMERPASGAARNRSTTPTDERGKKRRKLRHVPAGAHLWDVPFPFNEGEGPESYRADWEKQRGKKLIAELLNLIKSAAKRAALKNRIVQRKAPTAGELAALNRHYNIDGRLAQTTVSMGPDILADTSNSSRLLPYPSTSTEPSSSTASFDQLISSLLSAPLSDLSFDSGRSTPDASSSLDAGLFDSWMDIFESFPAPEAGFAPIPPSHDLSLDPFASDPLSFDFPFDAHSSYPTSFDDSVIDPVLLALSASNLASLDTSSLSGCPSLVHSPIPSSSSLTSELLTPAISESGFGDFTPVDEAAYSDKGKQREVDGISMANMSSEASAIINQPGGQGGLVAEGRLGAGKDAEFSMVPTLPIMGSIVKADILNRAKARREQLVREIERTRIALWETTIEGGVLATLVNKYST